MASAWRRCSSICRTAPSWRSTARTSRWISKANSSKILLSGNALRIFRACSNQTRASESAKWSRSPPSCLPKITHGFFLQLALHSVVGKPIDMFAGQLAGGELFYRIHDTCMNFAAAFAEHCTVSDLVSEVVLKGVLHVGKQPRR